MKRYTFFALIISFVIGGIVAFGFSYGIAVGVQKSADGEFCTTCHTMDTVYKSNQSEKHHGGHGKRGTVAKCAECHADHTSLYSYLMSKITFGLHDAKVTLFDDVSKIDWEEKRKHREEFVFDTGCLECHHNLKDAPNQSIKQIKGHLDYFKGLTDKKCVSCHEHVGHDSLGEYIKNSKKEK